MVIDRDASSALLIDGWFGTLDTWARYPRRHLEVR
jgi:hypothetical protein